MAAILSQVLNMSMTGSVVILFVIAARLLLKKFPKIYAYILWAVVLFRLLCPVSLSASVSLLSWLQPDVTESTPVTSTVSYLPAAYAPNQEEDTAVPQAAPVQTQGNTKGSMDAPGLVYAVSYVWLTGASVMVLYSMIQFIRLRRKLIGAAVYWGNVYLADNINTPFVLGVLRPRVYLPSSIPTEERRYIISHEQHHTHRGDPMWKLLGYGALCIHWFNPLVWAAFILAGNDMEMSCDEAVIQKLGPEIRADYSVSLLRLSSHRKIISGMPLAFGEGDTKGRVLNMAKWKEPKRWVSIVCVLLCAAVLVACAVNPSAAEPTGNAVMAADPGFPIEIGPLPEGYSHGTDKDNNIIFTDGTNTVGGVMCYPIPDGVYDPYDDTFLWLEDVGIADYEDSSLAYIGGIYGPHGGWSAEFTSDVPDGTEPTVKRRHTFYVVGGSVYDIWFDMLLIDYNIEQELLQAVPVSGTLPAETGENLTAEAQAFAKCRAVMDAVQSGSYHITAQSHYNTDTANRDTSTEYFYSDGDWLRITHNSLSERHAALSANDRLFTSRGEEDLIWTEDTSAGDYEDPWLGSFLFIRHNVTYMDTLTDTEGECVMYRCDVYYNDTAGYPPDYFVRFYFDPDGNFIKVQIEVDMLQDDDLIVTESIVSLDTEAIAAEIQKEYQRAIG